MPDSQMQPEPSSGEGRPEVHGLDVSAMSADLSFLSNGDVTVTVNITGTGTDTTSFNLYGASNTTSPKPVNGSLLEGPVAQRPTKMSGSGTWTSNKQYTVEVSYTKSAKGTGWSFTVPATSISGRGPYSFSNLTLSKRASP